MDELKVCLYCECKTVKTKLAQMYIEHPIDCTYCSGSGEEYLSDGVYASCGCAYYVGPWFMCDVCSTCNMAELNKSRKVTARRVRAHLRLLVMSQEKGLINRLESLFLSGMSWGNRKEWHIDHIKPIKSFLDEGVTDINVINDPLNLQPLWAKDNLSKGSKYIENK